MSLRSARTVLRTFQAVSARRPCLTLNDQGKLLLSVPDPAGGWIPMVFEDVDLDASTADVIRECRRLVDIIETGDDVDAAFDRAIAEEEES